MRFASAPPLPTVPPVRPRRLDAEPASASPATRSRGAVLARRGREPLALAAFHLAGFLLVWWYGGPWTGTIFVYVAMVLLAAAGGGLYRLRLTLRFAEAAPRLLAVVGGPLLVVAASLPLQAPAAVDLRPAILAAAAFVCAHGLGLLVIREIRRRRIWSEATVIVGAGELGRKIAGLLRSHPEHGLLPVGFVDSLEKEGEQLPFPHLGDIDAVERVLADWGISRLVLAYGSVPEARLVRLVRWATVAGIAVHVVPRFFDIGLASRDPNADEVWGIPLYRVQRAAHQHPTWPLKRSVDVLLAGTALVVAAPLLVALAVAVRLSGPGPILFRQQRIGRRGVPFELLKFRSIRTEQCSDTEAVAHPDAVVGAAPPEPTGVTPVGALLRRSSLDELPQLWNVIRGDMSLIGPRPERPVFVDVYSSELSGYADRHRLPVGLSGWAQVHGLRGSDSSIEDRVRFDNYYIDRWSLWLDFVIGLRTFAALVRSCLERPARNQPGP